MCSTLHKRYLLVKEPPFNSSVQGNSKMAKNHFPQVSQWSFGGYLVYKSDLGILSYLRLLKKSRTMHPSHQSNLFFVLNTIKVRRKEKQSSCPLNIKLIKWANILPCLILFVYCIQHAIHTHSMLPLVLPIYMITYIIYIYDYLYRSCLYIW